MSDIVDRLRVPIDLTTPWSNLALHADAATEIERLRAGLRIIVDADGFWDAPSLARDLLDGKAVTHHTAHTKDADQ